MPLVLIAVGIALVVAAMRGTLKNPDGQSGLLDLLHADFVGPGNFFAWVVAIGLAGSIGYVRPLRPLSDALMVLIIIVFLLAANKGGKDFFSSLTNQLVTGTAKATGAPAGTAAGASLGTALGAGIPTSNPSLDPFSFNPIANSVLNSPSLNVTPFNPQPIGAF